MHRCRSPGLRAFHPDMVITRTNIRRAGTWLCAQAGLRNRAARHGIRSIPAIYPSCPAQRLCAATSSRSLSSCYRCNKPKCRLWPRTTWRIVSTCSARAGCRCGTGCDAGAWRAIATTPARPSRADAEGRWLEGRINRPNLAESQRVWRLVEPGYEPWIGNSTSSPATAGPSPPGIWTFLTVTSRELTSRCRGSWRGCSICRGWHSHTHWPAAAPPALRQPDRYLAGMRNQILDFIATNPPRFGVNWRSAMEVAIRAANWVHRRRSVSRRRRRLRRTIRGRAVAQSLRTRLAYRIQPGVGPRGAG